MSAESSLTLDRGLALLHAVAEAEGQACGVAELAGRIEVSRAAVYRLLGPLTERGLVRRDGTRIRLGIGLLRLAERVLPQLREAASPVLRELAEQLGATAHLSVADADAVQTLAVVEPSWTSVHVACRVGARQPLTSGAAGKAIALRQDEGPWVAAPGEPEVGTVGVAAPVRGVPGLRASVGVLALGEAAPEVAGARVVAAAAALARALSG